MDDQSVQWLWEFEKMFIMRYESSDKNLRALVIDIKKLLRVEGKGV